LAHTRFSVSNTSVRRVKEEKLTVASSKRCPIDLSEEW
jgi:hypothetical protein